MCPSLTAQCSRVASYWESRALAWMESSDQQQKSVNKDGICSCSADVVRHDISLKAWPAPVTTVNITYAAVLLARGKPCACK